MYGPDYKPEPKDFEEEEVPSESELKEIPEDELEAKVFRALGL